MQIGTTSILWTYQFNKICVQKVVLIFIINKNNNVEAK